MELLLLLSEGRVVGRGLKGVGRVLEGLLLLEDLEGFL